MREKESRDYSVIYLNGKYIEVHGEDNFSMVAEWLRRKKGLTGCKIVCAEGDCGACSILRYFPHKGGGETFEVINACIATVAAMDGSSLVTVEGIGTTEQLSIVQKKMVECNAAQCGYCIPGFVVAISAAAEKGKPIGRDAAKNATTGNLCRCGAYLRLVETAVEACACSKKNSLKERYLSKEIAATLKKALSIPLEIASKNNHLVAPTTIEEAAKAYGGGGQIVASMTDLGVVANKKGTLAKSLVSLHLIEEMYRCSIENDRVRVGAKASIASLRKTVAHTFPELARLLNIFASPQIKNMATLAGNVATGSPIGDTIPLLLVCGGEILFAKWSNGTLVKRVVAAEKLYSGYRQMACESGELITEISFSIPTEKQFIRLYKVSQRKDLDISTLSAAFCLEFDSPSLKGAVKHAKLALGGVADRAIRLPAIEEKIEGAEMSDAFADEIASIIPSAIHPIDDVRGSAAYRRRLAGNLFLKFFRELESARVKNG